MEEIQFTTTTTALLQIALVLFIAAELIRIVRKYILPKNKMTYGDFITTKFGRGDTFVYHYKEYDLLGVDFEDNTFGYRPNPDSEIKWIGFENCYYTKAKR